MAWQRGIRLVWRVLRHWTEIADGGPDEVDAQAGAVRPRVPDRPECGASGHPGRLQRQITDLDPLGVAGVFEESDVVKLIQILRDVEGRAAA